MIPKVEFPLTQEQVAPAAKSVLDRIKALEGELKLCKTLLGNISEWCEHPDLGDKTRCPSCDKYFSRCND